MFEKLMIMLALSEPTLCSIEGDGAGGGGSDGGAGGGGTGGAGGGTPPPKTFTQDEVTRIAAKQKQEGLEAGKRAAEEAVRAAEEAAKVALAEKEARIQELELAGKTAAERAEIERKQREEADAKARKAKEDALAKELADAKAAAASATARWRGDRINAQVTSALIAGKAISSAVADASETFVRVSKIETDDEGQITSVIYGGKSFTKLDEAAKEFLSDRSHFAQASGANGTGTRPGSNGGGGHGSKPLWQMSAEELKQLDHAQSSAGK